MIQQLDTDTVSTHIEAGPSAIYDIVADITRTHELSPEITQCRWLDGATGAEVGARFKATNKMPNRPAFTNKPVVTIADRAARSVASSGARIDAGTFAPVHRRRCPARAGPAATCSVPTRSVADEIGLGAVNGHRVGLGDAPPSPASRAETTGSARLATPSLVKMPDT